MDNFIESVELEPDGFSEQPANIIKIKKGEILIHDFLISDCISCRVN